jgi:hypothetical protein
VKEVCPSWLWAFHPDGSSDFPWKLEIGSWELGVGSWELIWQLEVVALGIIASPP